jgi:hypothetical protein
MGGFETALKRVKNPVDKDTYNDHRQYDGKDHLFGIEFFHGWFELTLMLQMTFNFCNED